MAELPTAGALSPREVVAVAVAALVQPGSSGSVLAMAGAVLTALATNGYTVIPTNRYVELVEIEASASGRFRVKLIIKPERDEDFYVGWSSIVEAPVWMGTRAEALAEGCPESRLRRADENGSSARRDPMSSYAGPLDGAWDDERFIAEQRGFLPRSRLAAYIRAYAEERWDDAWDLLEPFDAETEVRRD